MLLMLPMEANAYSAGYKFEYGGLRYTVLNESSNTVACSGYYDWCEGDIVIPEKVNNGGITYTVVQIGNHAFSGCSDLTSITIPNSVTAIGDYAFYDCSGLTSISIPNSVTAIGDYAFYDCSGLTSISIPNSVKTIGKDAFCGCSSLTSITIPNSVTAIGNHAFYGCSGLTSINVDAANQEYSSKDGVLYNKKQTSLIRCPGGKRGEVIIPNSVTTIDSFAFSGCSGLTSITIPNSVTAISSHAFFYCSSLTSITIPNSVTYISVSAFENCSSLTSITIPNSVTTIDSFAFSGCSGLTSITIPNSVTTIGGCAFFGCSLTSITIPSSVKTIWEDAFSGYSGLTSINVDAANQAYSSKDGVLYNKEQTTLISCPGGKRGEMIIPSSVTIIWSHAFYGCRLTSITIPSSVMGLGQYLFFGYSGLTSVYYIADDPIESTADVFYGSYSDYTSIYNNATLYVPANAVNKCKQIDPWKNFKSIEAYDFAGVDDISVDAGADFPCEVYNINGVKIAESTDNLAPGIYIVRQGSAVKKIVVN